MDKINIGLFGNNGHQIQHTLVNHPMGICLAAAEIEPSQLPQPIKDNLDFRTYTSLEAMLQDNRLDMISLCSPRRREQAEQAVFCLLAGKHVYAEKPCAMTEDDLDKLILTSEKTGKSFHEMAGTAFEQPYLKMREIVQSGLLGTIVQILAQKSYPYHDRRPQDENVDGGLLMQAGVHALRFIEHVAGERVSDIYALETILGNPKPGNLRMATSLMMQLENGGVASMLCNYLNPPTFGTWGNESLRIFGTNGMLEAVDGGTRTRLVLNDKDCGSMEIEHGGYDYLDLYLNSLLGFGEMPLSLEEELHPTRIVIRAKKKADELKVS